MAPDPTDPPSDDARTNVEGSAIEPGELYVVIRKAVEDAILGVIGTLLLVGVAFVLVWFGIMIVVSASDTSPLGVTAGVLVTVVGLYVAASTLGVVPSVTDLVWGRNAR